MTVASRYVAAPRGIDATAGPAAGERVLQSLRLSSPRTSLTLEVVSLYGHGTQRNTGTAEEVLFVVGGSGRLSNAGREHPLSHQCAAAIPPETSYRLQSSDGGGKIEAVRVSATTMGSLPVRRTSISIRRLEDCETGAATGNRDFQVLADSASGFTAGTLFVGNVPPGPPAPVHYHTYDEVLFLLEGQGVLHIDGEHTPIGPGSCYRLPARTLHQIENTGDVMMREVAVFVPSGSPAAAYLPDGRGAFPGLADDLIGPAGRGSVAERLDQ